MCHGQILNEAMVVARKAHRCDICSKPIPKGLEHYVQTVKDDGPPDRWRTHARCASLLFAAQSDGECMEPTIHAIRDESREQGWREILRMARKNLERIAGLRRKPA